MRNATHAQALTEAHAVVEREARRLTFDDDPATGARLLMLAAMVRLSRASSRDDAARLAHTLAAELQLGRL